MMTFKVGDRVERTGTFNAGDGWIVYEGDTGTVSNIKMWRQAGQQWFTLVDLRRDDGSVAAQCSDSEWHNAEYFKLVPPTTNHKTNDAPTSVAAAVSIKPKKASIKDVILELLDKYKTGLTGQEIAEYSGLRLNSVTPRFAELSRWGGSPYQKSPPAIMNTNRTRSGQIVWVLYTAEDNHE
jgi:hypothetical protein